MSTASQNMLQQISDAGAKGFTAKRGMGRSIGALNQDGLVAKDGAVWKITEKGKEALKEAKKAAQAAAKASVKAAK